MNPEDAVGEDGHGEDEGGHASESQFRRPFDDAGNVPPWWHSVPSQPPVDSVFVEGLKLAGALRDWAVESGAVAAATELAQNAATAASGYLAQATAPESQTVGADDDEPVQPVVRCSDCPVCQGLDALERTNPEWAQTARSALAQISALMSGFLGPEADRDGWANP